MSSDSAGETTPTERQLKEVDAVIFVQLHDRLFPRLRLAHPVAETPKLALAGLGTNLRYLDVEQGLDRFLDVQLRRIAMNLKRVLIISGRAVHTLFRHERLKQHLVRLKLDRSQRFLGRFYC